MPRIVSAPSATAIWDGSRGTLPPCRTVRSPVRSPGISLLPHHSTPHPRNRLKPALLTDRSLSLLSHGSPHAAAASPASPGASRRICVRIWSVVIPSRLGLEVRNQTVPQRREDHGLDVVKADIEPALGQSPDLGRQQEHLGAARAAAKLEILVGDRRRGLRLGMRREHEPNGHNP